MIENRMVVDSEWRYIEPVMTEPEEIEHGYYNIGTGELVSDTYALEYAQEHEEQADMTDDEFVEWFFSGNWVRR